MNKYSTDEIVKSLQGVMNVIYAEPAYEAIARLRAADALLRAAKAVKMAVIVYASPHDNAAFEKAMSAYEGKED
jgi:hypothetical protein